MVSWGLVVFIMHYMLLYIVTLNETREALSTNLLDSKKQVNYAYTLYL